MSMSLVMTRIVRLTSFLFEINHDKSERKNASCTSINQESKKKGSLSKRIKETSKEKYFNKTRCPENSIKNELPRA